MMDINEIKKELLRNKTMANFSHYIAGTLYYRVKIGDKIFEFGVPTVEMLKSIDFSKERIESLFQARFSEGAFKNTEEKAKAFEYFRSGVYAEIDEVEKENPVILSKTLGSTTFESGIRASHLNKWIGLAIENCELAEIYI